MFFLLSPAPLSPSCRFCACSCLLSFTPSPFMPAVGLSPPHTLWQPRARQWALVLGKESLQCFPPTEAFIQAQGGVGEGQKQLVGRTGNGFGCGEPTGAHYVNSAHGNLSSYSLLCVSSSLRAAQVLSFMHLPWSCLILVVHICILLTLSFVLSFFFFKSHSFSFYSYLFI